MFPPFSQESARHYCQKLISYLDTGKIELEQCGRQSLERKGQGLMIGALVCWEKSGKSGHRVVLYAVSGNNKKLKMADCKESIEKLFSEKSVFVPSIVSGEKIDQALEENDLQIHRLTEQINELTLVNKTSDECKKLVSERTKLTDASLKKVFTLYNFIRFDSKAICLNEIIRLHGNKLPPTGTGDCCDLCVP